jgi:hypothetical protein
LTVLNIRFPAFSAFILICSFCGEATAQLSGRALSVARHGKLPNLDQRVNPATYGDLTLEYRRRSFLGGFRVDGYRADNIGRQYERISQKYLEYAWDWGSMRAGNSYGIFGRGLIFRGFELPGFVYESRVFRTQHRVIRDINGFNLKLNPGPFDMRFISGETPVNALDPPETQVHGDLTGGQVSVDLPASLVVGTAYLEYKTGLKDKLSTYFASWSVDALLAEIGAAAWTLDLYAEYATNQGFGKIAAFSAETSHALYLTGNFSWRSLGGSVEYKDFQSFDFGINDPPPLIRENSEYLLNRITHRLDAFGETGFQTEMYYSPQPLTRLTANFSRARNNFDNVFLQRYIGVEKIGSPWSTRAFFDYGKEEFLSEPRRLTGGIAPDYTFNDGTVIGLDVQWQHIKREFSADFNYTFTNVYTSFSVQNLHSFSFALSAERSTDPDVTLVNPLNDNAAKYFLNGSVGWTPNHRVSVQLFAGERRRSTRCDHGFCIEVLDFKGLELRLDLSL